MPRGNQSGIHYGQKKQNGQSDLEQLIAIKQHLKQKYKINAKREPYLLFKDDRLLSILDDVKESQLDRSITIKNPDLLWFDKYGMWILELDGAVHLRKSEKTHRRNELYLSNHVKLIVVPLYEMSKDENIYDYIDNRILELIRG